jgi:long-subunit acyl-CoA synthetase (AMP-forming)
LTYGDLPGRLDAERRWVRGGGGERFAMLAENGLGWAVADLALHLEDALSVPLPAYFTVAQRQHALDDAGIDCLLTDAPEAAREWLPGWQLAGRSGVSGLTMFRRTLDPFAATVPPARTAKVTYTSGSTSAPKGVCLSAGQLETVATSLAVATASLPLSRHLCLLPLPTLLENVAGLYAPLLRGATCLLPGSEVTGMSYAGPDPSRLLACIAGSRPDSLILVPELLQLLVHAAEHGWPVPESLRFVAVGGASVATSLLERAAAAGLPVFEGYGLSECASVVCLNTPGARRPGSVGRPLPHAGVRIAADGEIHVTGTTFLGYLGDAPRQDGEELATGDLGTQDEDGFVTLHGRRRNVFFTSLGRNVTPEWVEQEIRQGPGIRHVMVSGESRPYPVALVSAGAEVPAAAIGRAIEAANARLPDYAQVRRWWRAPQPFSFEDGLLTANGRLRRDAIAARYGAELDALYRHELAS